MCAEQADVQVSRQINETLPHSAKGAPALPCCLMTRRNVASHLLIDNTAYKKLA